MSNRFPGEVVASHHVVLGEVEQNWHSAAYDRSIAATVGFETVIGENGIATVIQSEKLKTSAITLRTGAITEDPVLVSNLSRGIAQIDELYRDYREISADTRLHHDVEYRVGRARLGASILHALTGNILPFSGPGLSHFDDFVNEDEEVIALCHRGVPTKLYEGPTRVFDEKNVLLASLSRFFVPISVTATQDHAILYDRRMLHAQSAQLLSLRKPGVFLRSVIRPE
ncbi:MAG: hypothetical protein ABIQ89_04480 [Candidatus Saccharimonadales bacterium]